MVFCPSKLGGGYGDERNVKGGPYNGLSLELVNCKCQVQHLAGTLTKKVYMICRFDDMTIRRLRGRTVSRGRENARPNEYGGFSRRVTQTRRVLDI